MLVSLNRYLRKNIKLIFNYQIEGLPPKFR